MLSITHSCALSGIEAYPITLEVDVAPGLPGFTMVGLPDSAVKESRERVFSALKNSGFEIPSKRITVNLAPGGIRKEGTAFELPLALGILLASEQINLPSLEGILFLGEVSLDGRLRSVRGVLPAALYAKEVGKNLIVPNVNGEEAALIPGVKAFAANTLLETLDFLRAPEFRARTLRPMPLDAAMEECDFSDVKGQGMAKRALEVAAAGGHNFLMVGSPGCGKTLLARRLPSILPAMSEEEGLETTRIYSVAGLLKEGCGILRKRPFRSPHHTLSYQALLGGGSVPRPGEMVLAHNGVLFLDEFPEFHRNVVEALRQPLEEGKVTIARASHTVTYPCRSMLGVSFNPCPCGYMMDGKKRCLCRMEEIARYRARLSGPMLDRIDIHLEMTGLSYGELSSTSDHEDSHTILKRVERARAIQRLRFGQGGGHVPVSGHCNGHMSVAQIEVHCKVSGMASSLLKDAVESLGLTARGYHRILKVARTVADLDESKVIKDVHIAEAIHYRCWDRQLLPFDQSQG